MIITNCFIFYPMFTYLEYHVSANACTNASLFGYIIICIWFNIMFYLTPSWTTQAIWYMYKERWRLITMVYILGSDSYLWPCITLVFYNVRIINIVLILEMACTEGGCCVKHYVMSHKLH